MPLPPLETASPVVLAQGDCYAIGEQVAAQNGGTLAKASQPNRGGQTVCVIVVLVPGKDGQRPRRPGRRAGELMQAAVFHAGKSAISDRSPTGPSFHAHTRRRG